MISAFVNIALPEEPSKNELARWLQGVLRAIASLTEAMSPAAVPILATVHLGDNQLRDQVIIDLREIDNNLANFLTALAKVRLLGRPAVVEAAEVMLSLLQKLFSSQVMSADVLMVRQDGDKLHLVLPVRVSGRVTPLIMMKYSVSRFPSCPSIYGVFGPKCSAIPRGSWHQIGCTSLCASQPFPAAAEFPSACLHYQRSRRTRLHILPRH